MSNASLGCDVFVILYWYSSEDCTSVARGVFHWFNDPVATGLCSDQPDGKLGRISKRYNTLLKLNIVHWNILDTVTVVVVVFASFWHIKYDQLGTKWRHEIRHEYSITAYAPRFFIIVFFCCQSVRIGDTILHWVNHDSKSSYLKIVGDELLFLLAGEDLPSRYMI